MAASKDKTTSMDTACCAEFQCVHIMVAWERFQSYRYRIKPDSQMTAHFLASSPFSLGDFC
eukprot:scaffold11524_cov63-Attheya_sp.AAC.2